MPEPERLQRAPAYRPTLVDPYRDHLKRRRAEDPAVPILHLFNEIKALGYPGSFNLLYRDITQGRESKPTGCPSRLAALPGSCSPTPITSRMSTGACWTPSPPPAPR
ncbi:hypothetical protein B0I32_14047 [Nonomuraea fuscirosea]|uniref:Transposase n=1 Tax=Nonomuraea fuscirosea TaxID=1291556 RepID=A0A2T0LXP9_9ACTN|nr:hypothetical protein B0I32_14047 [Nonomuraea fuscirosea]